MGPLDYVKEHPYTVAGVIGAGLILYLLFNSGSSSAAAPATSSSDTALQQAQLALQGQAQALQYQLAGQQTQAGAAVAIATLQSQLGEFTASEAHDVSLAGIAAQQNVQLAGINSQTLIAQGAQATETAQINATRDVSLANAATFAHIQDVQGQTQVALANINAQAYEYGQKQATNRSNTSSWAGALTNIIAPGSTNPSAGGAIGGLLGIFGL